MTKGAIVMMSLWMGIVTIMTIYFFYRVITASKKEEEEEEDS